MVDPDGIYPGQTWTSRYQTGTSVRITVVDGPRIGYTPNRPGANTSYLTRRRFLVAFQQIRSPR